MTPSFFIDRPILATVLAIVIVIAGVVAIPQLPVSEYPQIAPPTVAVGGIYPSASAKTVAETVISPLEQEINGVENALYMSSQTQADGSYSITITFALGTDLDAAQVQVQNRVAQALPRLPEVVRALGVTTLKRSPDLTMVLFLTATDDRYDALYLRNYARIRVRDALARIPGMGEALIVGSGDYAMRLWLDPGKLAARELTAGDVLAGVREQNVQVAAGVVGGQPALAGTEFEYTVNVQGRLDTEEQFGAIVIKVGEGGDTVYLRDVARLEMGPETYAVRSLLDGRPAIGILVFQLPGANAIALSDRIRAEMAEMSKDFPQGVGYEIPYDPTVFVRSSIESVVSTLLEAVLLVVLVVLVFLQTWRATVIPLVAIPVSIIGTFAALLAFGFTINALTLFGMVLAVGIVVDDAIVVVENVQKKIESGMAPLAAAHAAMAEVARPILSIMLVLCAVFIPVAFVTGITGEFYRQFAATIAVSTVISTINSLTLSPALCALLLTPHGAPPDRLQRVINAMLGGFFARFNWIFDRGSDRYAMLIGRVSRHRRGVLALFVLLLGVTVLLFRAVPGGFVPSQDKQFLIAFAQLPDAASLDRTDAVVRQMSALALATPGVKHAVGLPGLSINGFSNSANSAVMFFPLDDFAERRGAGLSGPEIAAALNEKFASISEAFIAALPPPPVAGIGTTGGFKLYLQDRAGLGYDEMARVTQEFLGALRQRQELNPYATYSNYRNDVPQLDAHIDRVKARQQGVPLSSVFETLQVFLGSSYINDFNRFGRTFRVYAQAEAEYRMQPEQVALLKTRNLHGDMVPLGSLLDLRASRGPAGVSHYNVFLAADINSTALPGISTGQASAAAEQVAAATLPAGVGFEWTDLTYQAKLAGNTALLVFPLCVLLVFLILAAQYESWGLPLAVILIVPMCLLSAMFGVWLCGMDNNIFTQIGFIVLVGLACKNAILIVEFAREQVHAGADPMVAAVEACRLRLRPILMTSFAFIMGVVPLALATGAGAEMRQAMGVAVVAGMFGVTAFGLLLTPVFFVALQRRRTSSLHAHPPQSAKLIEVQS
jgi:hydrophobe/amphiphile efflux-1 (HAE1) family protein